MALPIDPSRTDPAEGRSLTVGEAWILRGVFRDYIPFPQVRVFNRRWTWPLPKDRSMAPNGWMYMPGDDYEPDFAAAGVPARKVAVFVHEGAHLYQWYGLGWTVWLRGSFDRNYDYKLVPGRAFKDYGLEQMGMIAQDYYRVSHDLNAIGGDYELADYEKVLPLK